MTQNSRHIFLELTYDGTNYFGWQIQPNEITVQQVLQEKLSILFGNVVIKVDGSSRTDTGVHSLGFGVTFAAPLKPAIPNPKLKHALNQLLPRSIKVKRVEEVNSTFHARYAAQAKAYTYVINTGDADPFSANFSWHLSNCTHVDEIKEGVQALIGTHDFSAFVVKRSAIENPIRTIYQIDVQKFEKFLCITFIGNGFLYKMVRSMMGAIAAVGTGKYNSNYIRLALESQDRSKTEQTSPPHGLFLMKVFYEKDEWRSFEINHPPFYM